MFSSMHNSNVRMTCFKIQSFGITLIVNMHIVIISSQDIVLRVDNDYLDSELDDDRFHNINVSFIIRREIWSRLSRHKNHNIFSMLFSLSHSCVVIIILILSSITIFLYYILELSNPCDGRCRATYTLYSYLVLFVEGGCSVSII